LYTPEANGISWDKMEARYQKLKERNGGSMHFDDCRLAYEKWKNGKIKDSEFEVQLQKSESYFDSTMNDLIPAMCICCTC
jgi:hypothetical protein